MNYSTFDLHRWLKTADTYMRRLPTVQQRRAYALQLGFTPVRHRPEADAMFGPDDETAPLVHPGLGVAFFPLEIEWHRMGQAMAYGLYWKSRITIRRDQ